MLEQAAQVATQVSKGVNWLDVGVLGLLVKASVDVAREFIRYRGERSRLKAVQAKADYEEAKSLGISLIKDRTTSDKSPLIAFCPGHIDLIERVNTTENEIKHINQKLTDIKASTDVIRAAVGKGN